MKIWFIFELRENQVKELINASKIHNILLMKTQKIHPKDVDRGD
jgi:hypothetical protein